jgi:hypothetical protein
MPTTSNYAGIWEKYVNGVYNNALPAFRQDAVMGLYKIYDETFTPALQEIFPRAPARDSNGNIVDFDTKFRMPFASNPQIMAQFMDRQERVKPKNVAFAYEEWGTRLVKEWGPTEDPYIFENQFKAGFLAEKNRLITQMVSQSITRKIEYETCQFLLGPGISNWGSLPTEILARRIALDCGETTLTSGSALSGAQWDNNTSDIRFDLEKIKLKAGQFGWRPTRAFIGPNTAFAIEMHPKIIGQIQYTRDPTNAVLSSNLDGIAFKVVLGQTYKDDSSNNTNKIGYPGIGNLYPDTYSTRRVTDMMIHTSGSTKLEWGVFAGDGPVGNILCSKSHPNQTDVMTPYPHSWKDAELELIYSSVQFAFGIYAEDFAKYITVHRMAEQKE